MNTKGLALATFIFGVFVLIGGTLVTLGTSNGGLMIAGAILMGSSLVALRIDGR